MKVLFLTPQLPYPPVSGGVIKSHKLLMFMAEHYQLALCCLIKSDSDRQNLAALEKRISPVPVYSLALNIQRTPLNFAKSCLAAIPLTIYRNRNNDFAAHINAVADQYDVIFVDHYLMFQYVPKNYQGRVVVHQHNAEFVIWSRMAEQSRNQLKKAVLAFESGRIKRYEVAMCNKADAVLAAPNDQQALTQAGVRGEHFYDTYHLGDEQNLFFPELQFNQSQPKILFIGTLSWEANVDGLEWFLSECWSEVKTRFPGVTFTIAGKHDDILAGRLRKLAPDIEMPGFVDDLEALYREHRVFVAPLRFGSGIKVKVVNGLYRGIPTVTTSVGAEGLELNHGEHLYIEDDAAGFATAVVTLLKEQTLWQQFSRQSRLQMQALYTWDVVFQQVKRSLSG